MGERLSLLFALALLVIAMTAIFARLASEYLGGRLTRRTLLVGGFLFAGIFGLFMACVQTLIMGPEL